MLNAEAKLGSMDICSIEAEGDWRAPIIQALRADDTPDKGAAPAHETSTT